MKRCDDAVGCKDQLFFEPKHVHGDRSVVAVERTERLDFLRFSDELVAERHLRLDVCNRVLRAVRHDGVNFFVGHQRRGIVDRPDLVANGRVGVIDQEVG